MLKSETTIRRELRAVRKRLKDIHLTLQQTCELAGTKATLQWMLGQVNVKPNNIMQKPPASRRPVLWIMDRGGRAVE